MYTALRAALPAYVPVARPRIVAGAAFLHVVAPPRDARRAAGRRARGPPARVPRRARIRGGHGQPPGRTGLQPAPNAPTGRVPAGAPVGAPTPGAGPTLVFETEGRWRSRRHRSPRSSASCRRSTPLADHSGAASGGEPFKISHASADRAALYLAHDHLVLSGRAQVEVEVGLAVPAPLPLALAWEYWDGAGWCGFGDFAAGDEPGRSFDATSG